MDTWCRDPPFNQPVTGVLLWLRPHAPHQRDPLPPLRASVVWQAIKGRNKFVGGGGVPVHTCAQLQIWHKQFSTTVSAITYFHLNILAVRWDLEFDIQRLSYFHCRENHSTHIQFYWALCITTVKEKRDWTDVATQFYHHSIRCTTATFTIRSFWSTMLWEVYDGMTAVPTRCPFTSTRNDMKHILT